MVQVTERKGQGAMSEKSLSHSVWDCTYHIVWIPKYRKKVLYGECKKEMREVLRELVERKDGVEIVEGSMCSDHVHICLRIPPKYAVSRIVGYLKGKSALMMQDRLPERRRYAQKEKAFWARGYYVSTVGINEATIKAYIKRQQEADKFLG
jgi:putative transposase